MIKKKLNEVNNLGNQTKKNFNVFLQENQKITCNTTLKELKLEVKLKSKQPIDGCPSNICIKTIKFSNYFCY